VMFCGLDGVVWHVKGWGRLMGFSAFLGGWGSGSEFSFRLREKRTYQLAVELWDFDSLGGVPPHPTPPKSPVESEKGVLVYHHVTSLVLFPLERGFRRRRTWARRRKLFKFVWGHGGFNEVSVVELERRRRWDPLGPVHCPPL